MSERKVLNKYYPPDFDPSKIPKLKLPKDRQYVVRLMAPFNMRCKTCGEYIYKGKKFNARKETVQNELYLGLPIFRFYIKCTRCLAEITFKTDPESTDYAMEHGATRNFQAEKLIEEEEKKIQQDREEEELNNPMKMLERALVKRLRDSDSEEETEDAKDQSRKHTADKPTDILTTDRDTGPQGSSSVGVKKQKVESWERSVGGLGGKGALGSLVVRKKPADSAFKPAAAAPRQAADTQTGS
uniref:Splicing factor YJU2 n=1 Tax=Sinocyclocheilus rhinocerous TaxID=307959 RepID=A0A673IIJ1_9TELE